MQDETIDPRAQQPPTEGDPTPAPDPGAETNMEELRARLDEIDRERQQFREIALRAQADLANYRRRVEDERDETLRQASARVVGKLLPVLDELRLAVDHAEKQGADAAWLEGIRFVHQKLDQLMEGEGLERLVPDGQPFDPWEHEALMYEPSTAAPDGAVLEVVRFGYKLHGRLIRPAQVVVAKAPAKDAEAQEPSDQ